MLPDGLPPPLSRRLCLSSFVGCCVALHRLALPSTLALLPLSSRLQFLSWPYDWVGCHVVLTGALASLPLLLRLRLAPPPLVAPLRPPCLVGCHVDQRTGLPPPLVVPPPSAAASCCTVVPLLFGWLLCFHGLPPPLRWCLCLLLHPSVCWLGLPPPLVVPLVGAPQSLPLPHVKRGCHPPTRR